MDTQDQLFDQTDWFPDWMPEQPALFWKGVLLCFKGTQSKMPLNYERIVRAAAKLLEPGSDTPCSKTTFERARHDMPELIPKPSTIRRDMRPPWIDEPSLLDPYKPAGVTLPLPFKSEDDKGDEDEVLGLVLRCKDGKLRWRPLQRSREWLSYTHSIAALFVALLMFATWADWLDADGDGMVDMIQAALPGVALVAGNCWLHHVLV